MFHRFLILFFFLFFLPRIALTEESSPAADAADIDEKVLAEEEKAVLGDKDSKADENHLSLEDCIAIALRRNFDIQRAENEISEALGVKLEDRSVVLPQVSAEANFRKVDPGRLPNFGESLFGSDRSWVATGEVRQAFFLGGEGLAKWRKGRFEVEAAEYAYQSALNQVLFDVRKRFYDVLLAKARVRVRRQSVKLLTGELELEKNKLAAGTVPEFNVLRAEVELANAQTPLIRSRNELRLALEELSRVLGLPNKEAAEVRAALRIKGELVYRKPKFDLPGALKTAFQKRPELRELELLRDIERAGVDIERSDYFPKLFAFAGWEFESSRFDNELDDVDEGWTVGVRAQWSIFDGRGTEGRIQQARSKLGVAEVALAQKKKDIEIEVRQALSDLLEARELVAASRKVVKRARESLRQASARLQSGVGRQIDLLDTQVALTEARTNEIEALHSFVVATAEVERATGSSLEDYRSPDSGSK